MGPLDRLLRDPDTKTAFDVASTGLTTADLRSLLLAVAEARAAERDASRILHQYVDDRFCAPVPIDAVAMARTVADTLAATAAGGFEAIQLSPLAPLATSSLVSAVPQNNVVSTMRMNDVVSDPTNVLALEATLRRRSNRSTPVRLSAAHRVVRAQRFDGPISFAHFSLLGLVSAGRDIGHRRFEVDELGRHLRTLVDAINAVDASLETRIEVSDHSGRFDEAEQLVIELAGVANEIGIDPERMHGQGYYDHLCAKVHVRIAGAWREVGDGGSTDWTQQLVGDRKERLVISGLGLDRLVIE